MAHKQDLINAVSSDTGSSKKDVGNILDSLLGQIEKTLKKGDSVTLIGFGTFKTVKRAARKGRNPQTGEEISIKASTTAKFSAGKKLKDSLN